MRGIQGIKKIGMMFLACAAMLGAPISAARGQEAAPAEADPRTYVKAVPYTSETMRDPFEGYIKKKEVPVPIERLMQEDNVIPPPLTITGITWGSSFPQAIVNGKVVKAGDSIDEVTVVSISKEGVVFLYHNQQFSLPAPAISKAKPAGAGQETR